MIIQRAPFDRWLQTENPANPTHPFKRLAISEATSCLTTFLHSRCFLIFYSLFRSCRCCLLSSGSVVAGPTGRYHNAAACPGPGPGPGLGPDSDTDTDTGHGHGHGPGPDPGHGPCHCRCPCASSCFHSAASRADPGSDTDPGGRCSGSSVDGHGRSARGCRRRRRGRTSKWRRGHEPGGGRQAPQDVEIFKYSRQQGEGGRSWSWSFSREETLRYA